VLSPLLSKRCYKPSLEISERRLNMESDERSIRIQWEGRSERDGQKYIYIHTLYEKIKNTVRRGGWCGEIGREREREREEEGEIVEPEELVKS